MRILAAYFSEFYETYAREKEELRRSIRRYVTEK